MRVIRSVALSLVGATMLFAGSIGITAAAHADTADPYLAQPPDVLGETVREVPALFGCVAVALVAVTILVGRSTDTQLLLRAGVVATLLLVLERGGSYALMRSSRSSALPEPTVIIGAGAVGVELARTLQDH